MRYIKWFLQTWSLYQFFAWLGGSGLMAFLMHTLIDPVGNAPLVWQIVLYISIALLFLVVIRLGIPWVYQRVKGNTQSNRIDLPEIEFYEDLDTMLQKRGGIERELEEDVIDSALVAWQTGDYFRQAINSIKPDNIRKIKRIILLDPDIENSKLALPITVDFQRIIKQVTKLAKENSIQVKWSSKTLMNVIIADPKKDSAWARVEMIIPDSYTRDWPSIVVYKSKHPGLFKKIETYYEKFWRSDLSHEPQPKEYENIEKKD